MTPPTADEVAAWVERTASAQMLTAKVTDQTAVEAVAALLGDGREPVEVRDATPG